LVGGQEQRLAQYRVAAFGGPAVPAGQAGGVQAWHQPGEGAGAGQGAEPVRVAEAAQDRGCGDLGDPGCGGQDGVRVGLFEDQRGAFVEVFDLLGQLQRQPGLDRDVLG
jgi:hypothetical protein